MSAVGRVWRSYSNAEKRDIGIYIVGIMFYKLGLEFFNGSITTLATDRFNAASAFTKIGAAQGLNQAAQCVGAILIAPLVKRWPTRTVLSAAIIMFSLMTAILLIVDAGTGGKFKDLETNEKRYGTWNPNLLFLIWTVSGICYGMVELIRRVIPADIVGGHVDKLRRMDATVHIFYEVAGTSGAFASSSAISRWGNNKSFFLTPVDFRTVFFGFAGATWLFISTLSFAREAAVNEEMEAAGLAGVDRSKRPSTNYLVMVWRGFRSFGESVWVGARLIFTNRCFIWLIPSYAIALYLHRFLENTLAPAFARRVLNVSAWSQIIVGGSNFGELLGALAVLLLSDYVPTPLPWLRFDAVALNIVWVLPTFARIATPDVSWAWKVAGCFIPISMGWAAGDVSLAAYIQSVLSDSAFHHERVSALGAVMVCDSFKILPKLWNVTHLTSLKAFLYTTYIVLNAFLSVVLGHVIDNDLKANDNIIQSLKTVGGVHFTVACAVVLASTFVPKGAFSFNPKALGRITTGGTPVHSDSEMDMWLAGPFQSFFRPERRIHGKQPPLIPPNIVRNQKYNIFAFFPVVFYEQFKFFFNLYFLVALSQFVPALKIGFIVTYVHRTLGVRVVRDDRKGGLRRLQTAPARQGDSSGTCFIRTDQLDGETDWKLRVAVPPETQKMDEKNLPAIDAEIYADPPIKDIHTFLGTFTLNKPPAAQGDQGLPLQELPPSVSPLTAENILWSNTVLAAGSAVGFVIYTGSETRAVMNTSHPETKVGLLELEINKLAKILCAVTLVMSVVLVALNGFRGLWYVYVFRFLILFSSIIPISLRVNLDMGKTVYANQIMNDPEIPNTIVRTSTLPEELGRITYLLSDKTGTLTQNEMEMRKLHMGTMSYGADAMDEVTHQLAVAFGAEQGSGHHKQPSMSTGAQLATRGRRDMSSRVRDVVLSLALCHNVTPVTNDDGTVTYQASSPDEVAIVTWTASVGLTLVFRDRTKMELQTPTGARVTYDILDIFPFTSESKRMGIVVRETQTGEITFLQKGADVVMAKIVQRNDWLEEETSNMAREGLRTLVMARKRLSSQLYKEFASQHHAASVKLEGRNEAMAAVVTEFLEHDLELLGLTGVEDKLQDDVKSTLELLRNAGIKIWMLTGDKVETARCIAISTKLVARNQYIHEMSKLKTADQIRDQLDFLQNKLDCCLVIDGESLQLCLNLFQNEFIEITTKLSAVVACRCSPTQKADVARLIRKATKKRVCCIGDGGNDVSMIQAADVGVGIVGKEGKQASLAADFSVTQFSYLTKLLLWHGRNSYRRSAKLAQFVIHRGLIISIMQAVFSAIFYFAPIALYQGWLLVGYATVYTMAPVFSLVLDRDVNEDLALLYPELYKELTKGRSLSFKTFFQWCMISLYQGAAIMIMSLVLFENEFLHIVSISFTALILNELIMVALEITTWHVYMVISEVVTLFFYVISIAFLPEYFDLSFVVSVGFAWKTAVIVAISTIPLYIIKLIRRKVAPAASSKLL
ncbi:hypothetical protein H1R20_g15573, partial [Candolleomyces eurysporus]